MSAAVDTLVRHLPQTDAEYSNYNVHRDIFTYVKEDVLPDASPATCPPLPVIVYAIQNILTVDPPSLDLLPALLRLLAHLEAVRTYTVEKLRDILDRNEAYVSQKNHFVPLLDDTERKNLEDLVRPTRLGPQRTVYRKIVHGICLLHVHHLWRTHDPVKHAPIVSYVIDYFPAFFQHDPDLRAACHTALQTHPWHHALTAEELADNREVGEQAVEFMVGAAQFTEDPDAYCREHGHAGDASFDEVFPAPDLDTIDAAISRFIRMVQRPYDALAVLLAERPPPDQS